VTVILRPDAGGLVEQAPAKLNLALHVRGRRADGYHDLETIFAFTDFGDTLRAAPADTLTLVAEGEFAAAAGSDEDNLVLRAARALAAAAGIEARAALHLTKRIPVAAGLGGGSADAAAALRVLDRLWDTRLGAAALTEIAAGLGADVPACVASVTCFGTGRGEVLRPVDLDLGGHPVVIVNPRVAVPTGPVFTAWNGVDKGALDPMGLLGDTRNDLTVPAVSIAPVIAEVIDWLAQQPGAVFTRMSGSGATVFALFEGQVTAAAAARAVPHRWWSTCTALRRAQPFGPAA
jgi:4-diphosphocytidyl-2-C-methyl-D-erythritol kinase